MEIPYEIKLILDSDFLNENDYIILDPSIFNYFTENEKYVLNKLINELGELSNKDRHLSIPITSFDSFINPNSNKKKLIFKCVNDIIIGFIYFEEKPILLRNDYNLNYFSKNLVTISDFYIMRNYRRMNYGKELFDKVIHMTDTKPVLMAFEYPNKPLMKFLEKNYGIVNPIFQANNIITFYNYTENNFNPYLDDYHRIIDVNKMEDDIDNYRKWSPINSEYFKRFNSGFTYKNIFPLQFNNNKSRDKFNYNELNNRYDNIENNYIKNYRADNYMNKSFINSERTKQFHLYDKKYLYGKKKNDLKRSAPISLSIKDITKNNLKEMDIKYFHKFPEYYLNQNKNGINFNNNKKYPKNSVKNNYYNYLNDENRYIRNNFKSQKKNENRLNMSVNLLNERIKNSIYKTPLRNKNDYDIYYRKNRSFATVFDSIENTKTEENDYINYKNYKKEYENFD